MCKQARLINHFHSPDHLHCRVAVHARFGIVCDATVIRAGSSIQVTAHVHVPVTSKVSADLSTMTVKHNIALPSVVSNTNTYHCCFHEIPIIQI